MSKVSNFIAVISAAVLLTIPLTTKANAFPVAAEAPLPACQSEDGFGVPLCVWDGIISGDCAPEFVGGFEISKKCVVLHSTNPKAVEECVTEWNLYDPEDPSYEGFTFEECLKAFE